jgi:hypothetical protein
MGHLRGMAKSGQYSCNKLYSEMKLGYECGPMTPNWVHTGYFLSISLFP